MAVASFIVSLREGIEIALILVLMFGYLRKTRQGEMRKYIFAGTAMAALLSVAVAFVMNLIWGIASGTVLEIFESTVVLIAAVLLTTMIIWMHGVGPGLASEIETSIEQKAGLRDAAGLAMLSFALVLREGVELVFFTLALSIEEGLYTYVGVATGLAFAALIGIGFYKGSLRVSFRSFFNWTSFFLVLFAAGMIAYGIHELQEAGLLLIGPLEIWNINPPLLPDGSYPPLHENGAIGSLAKALFGYNGNPSVLEVFAYVAYLVLVSIYYLREKTKDNINKKSKSQQIQQVTPTIESH